VPVVASRRDASLVGGAPQGDAHERQGRRFVGSIPDHGDRDFGSVISADFAAATALRVAAPGPAYVQGTAAGTGIVAR
jgi:hypothetical protein